jgi:predicted ATPase
MSKIRIKNFGPIKEGLNDKGGWLDIKKVTIFIGNQGSGKSTIAKLISVFSWLEKALVRGDFKEKDLIKYNRLTKQFAYQNIDNYIKPDTEIEYSGDAYRISYINGTTHIEKNEKNGYLFPKIMYVPAERNFTSSVKNPSSLKRLPDTLYTFLDELDNAQNDVKDKVLLPVNDVKYEYQKLNKIGYISGDGYKIRLSEASSGFQSLVPLFLVTKNLATSIGQDENTGKKNLSVDESNIIRKEIEKILSNPNLTAEVKKASLEYLSARFKYSCFINIVEEPEQNLFPSSQRGMLNFLMECNNLKKDNKLVITTHSPYILMYLNIAVQSYDLKEKIIKAGKSKLLSERLYKIAPEKSLVSQYDSAVYELDEKDGSIKLLPTYEGIISSKNILNMMLREGNELFDSLLEIEQEL